MKKRNSGKGFRRFVDERIATRRMNPRIGKGRRFGDFRIGARPCGRNLRQVPPHLAGPSFRLRRLGRSAGIRETIQRRQEQDVEGKDRRTQRTQQKSACERERSVHPEDPLMIPQGTAGQNENVGVSGYRSKHRDPKQDDLRVGGELGRT